MKDLLEAINIFIKYGNPNYPTNCSHDELYVNIDSSLVSEEDIKRLDELGFFVSEEYGGFLSYKFGSC